VAGNDEAGWAASPRGLSPQDLAMQVVLPELDGRILAGAIGCKIETNGVRRSIPLAAAIDVAADRAAGWIRLARTPPAERRIAIVLSDYPGVSGATHSVGHAVGLDGPASLAAILGWLHVAGYDTPAPPDPDTLTRSLLASRRRVLRFGRITVAVQPDRGGAYHDPAAEPCRAYVAFHRWLARLDAVVHLGTHGTLEWLPGKAVALSAACWPARLMRKPVIYPFIVNNPGEAAVAKRRLGAVTIGHLTPPLIRAELSGEARAIERLIDEYAECEAMDRRRAALLADEIVERAASSGLMAEAGTGTGAGDDVGALAAYLCDVKELRIADGLHVYGRPPAGRAALLEAVGETHAAALDASAGGERASLLAALDGRFVEPGPAGAPSRGRSDVLPTGRNLTGIDPRMVPTPSATRLAARTATCLLARHLQDTGEDLERLVLDLWGSASLRTGGEDLALAFVLMGCVPVHCDATGRMTGVDILPPALLDRPRVDVTLRVSGLFRDAFAGQIAMFDQAVARLSGGPRVFGPSPGTFGISDDWLAGSAFAYGAGVEGAPSPDQLARLVSDAQALVHQQDHHETDILDGPEHAAHEGGFARAARALGASPALYHLDITGEARVRTVAEEIRRVTRGRLANPVWLAAMRRHGYRGASEMARGVEALADFARALPCRFDAQFDLAADAILADAANARFLAEANEAAHAAIRDTLSAMTEAGLWHPRRNDPDALR
jgi:cobaltochelatase CobN